MNSRRQALAYEPFFCEVLISHFNPIFISTYIIPENPPCPPILAAPPICVSPRPGSAVSDSWFHATVINA